MNRMSYRNLLPLCNNTADYWGIYKKQPLIWVMFYMQGINKTIYVITKYEIILHGKKNVQRNLTNVITGYFNIFFKYIPLPKSRPSNSAIYLGNSKFLTRSFTLWDVEGNVSGTNSLSWDADDLGMASSDGGGWAFFAAISCVGDRTTEPIY
jgi:hypothetical protein